MFSRRARFLGLGLLVTASITVSSFVASPQHLAAVDTGAADAGVFGYWKRIDEDTGKPQSIFRLWEDKGKLIGKIVKVYPKGDQKPQEICSECTGAQKDKPVNGLIFLWGFTRDQSNARKWIDGKVLNPENGKTYNCEVELSEDGKTLNVYGYIRMLVKLGGTSKWQRATAAEIHSL